MKLIKLISGLSIAAVFSANLLAQGGTAEQLTVPLSDPGKPFWLNVGLVNGSLEVVTYDGKDVVIDAHAPQEDQEEGRTHTNGMKRLSAGNAFDLTATEKGNHVQVGTGSPNKTVNLSLKIPKSWVNMKLSTVNNGNIIINGVSGELEIVNVNGYIEMTGVSGSVVANTVNGHVKVSFISINPQAAMAFSTLNGDVDVSFPAGLKANFKIKSDRGEIFTDFDMVTEKRKPVVKNESKPGMYSIKMDDWVYGKVAEGGPEFLMKNMNGNIYVRKAK